MFRPQTLIAACLILSVITLAAPHSLGQSVKWNNSASGIWSAGPNWFGGFAPQAGDVVTIDAQDVNQPDYWVTLDVDATIDYLTLSTVTGGFRMTDRTFTTVNGASLGTGRTSMVGSIWNTNGNINNAGDFLLHASGSTSNSNTINGNFSNNNGTLEFYTVGRTSSFTVNGESSNGGRIEFRNNNGGAAFLNVNNTGTFSNSGLIKAFAPSTGSAGNSYVRTNQFSNSGSVVNESGATMVLDRSGATYVNGNIFAGTNGGFSFSNFASFDNLAGGNMQATSFAFAGQGAGTSTMVNSGYLGVLSGNLSISGTALTNNGTIAGATSSALSISGINFTQNGSVSGFGSVNFSGTTVNGPGTYTNVAGTAMSLSQTTFNTAVVNDGTMNQDVVNDVRNNWFNNGFTNHTGAEYLILTRSSATNVNSYGYLNVDGNIDNHGTIVLQGQRVYTHRIAASHLYQTNGTFTNHAGGILESRSATSNNSYNSFVRVDNLLNHGTIANNNSLSFYFDQDHANYTNSSTGTIQGAAMIFDDFDSFANAGNVAGSSQTFRGFENTTSTFSNSGTFNLTTGGMSLDDLLTIDNSGTLGVSGGNLTIGSNVGSYGTFNNSGAITSAAGRTVTFRGGIYNHNPGATITGGDYLSFNSTTLNLNTDFTTDFAAAGMASSTVNGPGTYTNAAGTTMSLSETTLNTAVVNNGIMNQDVVNDVRNNWFNNGFTNHTGAEYLILTRSSATNVNSYGYLNVDGNIDNHGTIVLQGQRVYTHRIAASHLYQTNGTFTNHAGGILESRSATSNNSYNSFVRVDNLLNHGTIANNNSLSFYFDQDHANYTNSSTGTIQGAAMIFDDFDSFANAGNVAGSSQTFRGFENTTSTFSNSGTFNLTTGGMSLDDLLTIDNSGTLGVSGGNLTIGSNVGSYGTFNNSGAITSAAGRTVTFRGGIYNHNPGATITGGDYLSFNSTTLNLNTDFTTDFAATGMASSTVNGPGTYTNAAGTTMSLSETTLNTAVVNNGIMNQDVVNDVRNNWFNNGFTNHTGAEYLILTRSSATNVNSYGYLNVDGDLDNHGTIVLQGQAETTRTG